MNRTFTLKAVFLLAFITSHFYSKAQDLVDNQTQQAPGTGEIYRPRTIYLELGGPGLALTANYDTRFNNTRDKWGYSVGAGYYNTGSNWVATVPLQINYLIGSPSGYNFLELGAGTTFVRSQGSTTGTFYQFDNITGFIGTATIGYRFQQITGGVNFRIGFVPILYDDGIILAGGVSLGYTF